MYSPKRCCSEEEKNTKRYNGEGYHEQGLASENFMTNTVSNPITEHYHVKGFDDVCGQESRAER